MIQLVNGPYPLLLYLHIANHQSSFRLFLLPAPKHLLPCSRQRHTLGHQVNQLMVQVVPLLARSNCHEAWEELRLGTTIFQQNMDNLLLEE